MAQEQNATSNTESKRLRTAKDKVDAETSGLLKTLAGGDVSGTTISGRLVELETQAAALATRLAESELERAAADQSTLDPNDLATALGLSDPIWDSLFQADQARIIELLIRRIEYNGKSDNPAISFHPTGIKALAEEIAQGVTA